MAEANHNPEPLPERWQAFKRVPSAYLLDAGGDVGNAATLAGVSKEVFLRALGSDDSLPDVARSVYFLTLMQSLDLATLASEEISRRFSEPPDPADDPSHADYDREASNPAALFDIKTLMGIFKFSAEYIALSASTQSSQAPRASTSRHMPPKPGKIIEAGRGIRAPTREGVEHPNPDFGAPTPNPTATFGSPVVDDLADRLANSPPEVRAIFQQALDRAAEAPNEGEESDGEPE